MKCVQQGISVSSADSQTYFLNHWQMLLFCCFLCSGLLLFALLFRDFFSIVLGKRERACGIIRRKPFAVKSAEERT